MFIKFLQIIPLFSQDDHSWNCLWKIAVLVIVTLPEHCSLKTISAK